MNVVFRLNKDKEYDNETRAICPHCKEASTLLNWNRITKNWYGDDNEDIVPITEDDFTDDGQLSGEPADCLYICPKCGKDDILGRDILKKD